MQPNDRPGAGTDITVRMAASTYIAVIAVYAFLAGYSAYNAMNEPASDRRGTAVVLAILAVFLVYFFARLRLSVSGGVLRYRNLLSERSLPLADIVRTEFRRRLFARDPRPILLITSGNSAKPLQLNLMPFRRDDIARFLEIRELKLEKGEDATQGA